MANLNNALKAENLYLEEVKEIVTEPKGSDALNNYLELSAEMSMQVLKVEDLAEDKTSENKKAEPGLNLNMPMDDNVIAKEPQIQKPSELSKTAARKIADRIQDEIRRFWTSKRIIKEKINEINSRTAYSFSAYMVTISESNSVLLDLRKYITCSDIKHLTFCLLKQAKDSGLVNIVQYSKLKRAYNMVSKICNEKPNKKPDKKTLEFANAAMEEMYEELSKRY